MIWNEELESRLKNLGINKTMLDSLIKLVPDHIIVKEKEGWVPYKKWNLTKGETVDDKILYTSAYYNDELGKWHCAGVSEIVAEAIGFTIARLLEEGYAELEQGTIIPIIKDFTKQNENTR